VTGRVKRAARAFGHFWWDFLIGDTPEFALVVGAVIGLAYLLDQRRLVALFVLPLFTAAFLLGSAYRGRRRTRDGGEAGEARIPGPQQSQ
jgi:hypothetical protein